MSFCARLSDYLGTRELYGRMLRIALPISAQSLITVGINLMDTIMLSGMGDAQLSASSQAGQFINLFMICCMGIGMGASVLTSRYWGMKEIHSLKKAVTRPLLRPSPLLWSPSGKRSEIRRLTRPSQARLPPGRTGPHPCWAPTLYPPPPPEQCRLAGG